MNASYKVIGKSVEKIDALPLACGGHLFTDDINFPTICCAKILYSPYASAIIKKIDISEAEKLPGVVGVLTHENVPDKAYCSAGQGYPEPSPIDFYLLNKRLRFIGDRVAVVVAENNFIAEQALTKIKVEYEVLDPVIDCEKSYKNVNVIHDKNTKLAVPLKYEPENNLVCEIKTGYGENLNFNNCKYVVENEYETHYSVHAMLEPHICISYTDSYNRLIIRSATQVPFHVRRVVSRYLDLPISKIRVVKPRIGGGFGGKQEILLEPLCAFITYKYNVSVKLLYSRKEEFISGRTRHPQKIKLKIGADKNKNIKSVDMNVIMNSGAYGSHCFTVACNTGSKVLTLFNKIENMNFCIKSFYTNLPVGGAFRGYGATQAYFAFCTQLDELSEKMNMDVSDLIKKHILKSGETSPLFKTIGEGKEEADIIIDSCNLEECINIGLKKIKWFDFKKRKLAINENSVKKRGIGMSVMMQGSSVPLIDMASCSIKMNEDGSFNLLCGATDLGTGSDTILAQIAAETLCIPVEKIVVYSSDTDITPFDVGAYASSTTYLSGNSVKKGALKVLNQILETAGKIFNEPVENLYAENSKVFSRVSLKSVDYEKIGYYSFYENDQKQIASFGSYISHKSPPPFSAHFTEVEVDTETGILKILKYIAITDCGQPINPKLAEGQVEGALIQGIGFALTEELIINNSGKVLNPNYGYYKILTSLDIPEFENILIEANEKTGPYGAKSIGEVCINGPAPAIANAIYDAVGIRLKSTPFTSEKIYQKIIELQER